MGIPPSGRGAMSGPAAAGQGGDYGSRTPRRTLLLPPPRGPPAARLRRGPPATALPGTLACDGGEAGAAAGFRSWWGLRSLTEIGDTRVYRGVALFFGQRFTKPATERRLHGPPP